MRYNLLDQSVTAGQWNLCRILVNKFDERNTDAGFSVSEHWGLLEVMMENPKDELAELKALDLIQAGTEQYHIKMRGKLRQAFTPSGEAIAPGSRRPLVARRWQGGVGEVATDALTRLSETPLRVNADVVSMLDDVDSWANPQVAASVKKASRKAGEIVYSDTYCDWRGRCYMQTGSWGSPQQSKVMRAIMDAAEARPLDLNSREGVYFLATIKAEYGITITTHEDVLEQPIRSSEQALAYRAALAIAEVIAYGKTAYLMEMDASCSGGQIIGLLTGDRALCEATNAIKNNVRGDIYLTLADDQDMDRVWHLTGLDGDANKRVRRNLAKPVVMVSFYGGGEDSIIANTWESYDGSIDTEGECVGTITVGGHILTPLHVQVIVRGLTAQLCKFPGFKAFKSWGQSNGKKITERNDEGVVHQWETASGFTAHAGRVMGAAALMPNFIHSVDGSIVQTVLTDDSIADTQLVTIHDAFLTTPDAALRVVSAVKTAYEAVIESTEVPTWGGKELACAEDLVPEIRNSTLVGI